MTPGTRVTVALAAGFVALTSTAAAPVPSTPIVARSLEIVRQVVPYDGRAAKRDGERVTVTLDADVLFEFDRADLTPPATATLQALGVELADRATGDVAVVGHTDALGEDGYNLDLSRRRAQAVQDVLAPLVDGAVTFTVSGRGEAEPVAANSGPDGADDPEGRRRNRRVELSYTVLAE